MFTRNDSFAQALLESLEPRLLLDKPGQSPFISIPESGDTMDTILVVVLSWSAAFAGH